MKNILENTDSNIIFDIKRNIIRKNFENRGSYSQRSAYNNSIKLNSFMNFAK